jgi:hypothetical protein
VSEEAVQLVGVAEAARDMTRWADQLGPAVVAGAGPFAEALAARVAAKVPVLTGTLAGSVEVTDAAAELPGIGVTIGEGVPYAGWIEFGGSRGRPLIPEGRYLYPTALDSEPEFAQVASTIAEETAERFPWSTPAT